jgi:serine/threonine protein kinase
VKLVDFGLAKEGVADAAMGASSLCGTPEYLSPEVLDRQGHGTAVDWWNLGMVAYEMLTGLPPWYTTNREKLFAAIRSAPLKFPMSVNRTAALFIQVSAHPILCFLLSFAVTDLMSDALLFAV